MTGHVKVGGTWKAVDALHVKVSGAWKEVLLAYVKVSGTWKQFFQSLTLVGGARGASFHTNAAFVSVGFRFNRDGTVQIKSAGNWVSSGVWITGSNVPSDVGDDYEIEVTFASGDTELQPTLADGAFRTLNVIRTFDKTVTPGAFHTASLTFTVREVADTANNETGSWTCATETGA